MTRADLERRLAAAESRVLRSIELIESQRAKFPLIERGLHQGTVESAREVLTALEYGLLLHIERRDRLRRELEQMMAAGQESD